MKAFTKNNIVAAIRSMHQDGLTATWNKTRRTIAKVAVTRKGLAHNGSAPDATLTKHYEPFSLPVPPNKPVVSIIIPVFNQWHYTYNCIFSLAHACTDFSYEVILADDGSTDETKNAENIITNLVIVKDGVNRRFLRNCNFAAVRAKGQFLFFLNNDTKCLPGSIDALVHLLNDKTTAGIAGSKLLYPDGLLQECGGIVFSDGTAANYGNRRLPDLPGYLHPRQVDYVSGAALMIRHTLWLELGGFDDRFAPAYYEDTDLAMAARQRGHEVWIEPKSRIIHFEGISNGTNLSTGLKAYQVKNQKIFAEKWSTVLQSQHMPPMTPLWTAAERPHHRTTILVIDHYVPTPDQDAGSACTRHYLETLSELGCRIIFLGANSMRSEPYTTELERLGIEVWVGNWYSEKWRIELRDRAKDIDIILFNRPHITYTFLPDIQRLVPHAKKVFFGHDLHFLREERAAALQEGKARQNHLAASVYARQQESTIYTQVDAALTISTDEANQIRKAFSFDNIYVFPGYRFPIRNEPYPIPTTVPALLFVGGFGHTPNQDGVDWFLKEVWPQIIATIPNARFWIVGSKMPDYYRTLGNGIEALGRLSDAELADRYARCHAVVAPLRYGAGLKGKVVQALSEGLPLVATTIGLEGLPEEIKQHINACDTSSDFSNEIIRICTSNEINSSKRIHALHLAQLYFSKKASLDFFCNFIPMYLPKSRWIDGLSQDGWLGTNAKIRLACGAYSISTRCPEFQFSKKNEAVVARIANTQNVVAAWRHESSGVQRCHFSIILPGVYHVSVSRASIPQKKGLQQDQRMLAIQLVELIEITQKV